MNTLTALSLISIFATLFGLGGWMAHKPSCGAIHTRSRTRIVRVLLPASSNGGGLFYLKSLIRHAAIFFPGIDNQR